MQLLILFWRTWHHGTKDDKKGKKAPPRSAPSQVVYDFKKTLKAARKLRDSLDMTEYQLVEMHDRRVLCRLFVVILFFPLIFVFFFSFLFFIFLCACRGVW